MKDLKLLLNPAVRPCFWGPPGVGKTAAIEAAGRKMGLHVETIISSTRDPSDFLGVPLSILPGIIQAMVHKAGVDDVDALYHEIRKFLSKSKGVFNDLPDWAMNILERNGGLLFLDEGTSTPPAVQAALLRIVNERVVGSTRLPENTIIVMAANPPEMAAGGWELAPAMAARFTHFQWKVEPEEWAADFPGYWGNPPQFPNIDPQKWEDSRRLVAAFIRYRPNLLLQVPQFESKSTEDPGWPNPRSWDHASRWMAIYTTAGRPVTDALDAVAGAIGSGPALEFMSWLQELDLPDPQWVLDNPNKFEIPDRADKVYALLTSIASLCKDGPNRRKVWYIIDRIANTKHKDAAVYAIRDLQRIGLNHRDIPSEVKLTGVRDLLVTVGMLPTA